MEFTTRSRVSWHGRPILLQWNNAIARKRGKKSQIGIFGAFKSFGRITIKYQWRYIFHGWLAKFSGCFWRIHHRGREIIGSIWFEGRYSLCLWQISYAKNSCQMVDQQKPSHQYSGRHGQKKQLFFIRKPTSIDQWQNPAHQS